MSLKLWMQKGQGEVHPILGQETNQVHVRKHQTVPDMSLYGGAGASHPASLGSKHPKTSFEIPLFHVLTSAPSTQILQKPTHELKQQLAGYSKRVASSVTELIQAAEAMKGKGRSCSKGQD